MQFYYCHQQQQVLMVGDYCCRKEKTAMSGVIKEKVGVKAMVSCLPTPQQEGGGGGGGGGVAAFKNWPPMP